MGQDAFDQTVAEIKALKVELDQNQQRIKEKHQSGEEEITKFRKSHKLNAPKDMFESDADYDARIDQLDALVEKRRDALQERYFEDMQHSVGEIQNQIAGLYQRIFPTNDVTVTLGTYNANNEFFPITFKINLNEEKRSWESRLNIKKDDARILYHDWDKVTKIGYISIDPEYRRALAMVKIMYPPILKESITWMFHEIYDLGDSNLVVSFSGDGKYLATGDTHGKAVIWKVSNGKSIWQTTLGTLVNAISFSGDGKYLAIGDNRSVTLWEVNKGKKIWQQQETYRYDKFAGNPGITQMQTGLVKYFAISFSGDGQYLATGDTRNITLWKVNSGRKVWQRTDSYWYDKFAGNPGITAMLISWASFPTISFSGDGQYLATGDIHQSGRNKVTLWEVNSGETVREMWHSRVVNTVNFGPDGKYLATGSNDKVMLWEVNNSTKVQEMESEGRVNIVTFSPDGQHLAVGGSGKTITFWRIPRDITIETRATRGKVIRASDKVTDLAWSPYGNLISDGKKVYRTLLQPEIYDVEKTVR